MDPTIACPLAAAIAANVNSCQVRNKLETPRTSPQLSSASKGAWSRSISRHVALPGSAKRGFYSRASRIRNPPSLGAGDDKNGKSGGRKTRRQSVRNCPRFCTLGTWIFLTFPGSGGDKHMICNHCRSLPPPGPTKLSIHGPVSPRPQEGDGLRRQVCPPCGATRGGP